MGWDTIGYVAKMVEESEADLEAILSMWSVRVVAVASLAVILLLLYSSRQKRMKNKKKRNLFVSICAIVLATTVFLFGTTIYINTISDSKGPVHWHTDIEFWACGTEIELRDPVGFLSNKVGSATYHEHDDKRIHLEGVVVKKEYDASLEKFMVVTGGVITDTKLAIPTNENFIEDDNDADITLADRSGLQKFAREFDSGTIIEFNNGDLCPSGEAGEIQAYVFSYNKQNNTYSQSKLARPMEYIMRDESVVPPGDCVIVEFGPKRDRTDKLCQQYGIRDTTRCEQFTGKERNEKLCSMYEVTATGGSN